MILTGGFPRATETSEREKAAKNGWGCRTGLAAPLLNLRNRFGYFFSTTSTFSVAVTSAMSLRGIS